MIKNLKKLLLILFLLLNFQVSFTQITREQEMQIDSLKQVINTAKHDTIIVNAWKAWDNIIYSSNPKLDFELNEKIEALCNKRLKKKLSEKEKRFFQEAQGSAFNVMGIIYSKQNDYAKSIEYYTKSLKIREEIGDKEGIANSFNNIGNIYSDQGNYSKGIECYTKSLKIEEEIDNEEGIAASLHNIGNIYADQRDYMKAIEYISQSLKIQEEIGNKEGIAASLYNAGNIYYAQKDYNEALKHYTKSLKIYEIIQNKQGIANSFNCIGLIYKSQGDYPRAIEYYTQSLNINEEIGGKFGIAVALGNIGNVYSDQQDYAKSVSYSERSLDVALETGIALETQNAAESLWKNYRHLDRFEDALEMYELYITTKNRLESEANKKEIIRQELKYDYEKKEAIANANHNAEMKHQETEAIAEQNQQNIIIVSISGGLGLMLLFSIFVFNRLRITRRQRNEIGQQKEVIEMAHKKTEKQKEIIEETHKEITDSINYAKRLQDAILPSIDEVNKHLPDNFIHFQPKDVVSGDFYWFEQMNGYSYLAVADCTGHGVPGAMVSVVCSNALNRSVKEFGITQPRKILDKTRELVIATFSKSGEDVKDGMDIALCAFNGKKVLYSGANNPLWIVRKTDLITQEQKKARSTIIQNELSLIEHKSNKQPVGLYHGMKNFTQEEIKLHQGDSLYFFTDGFADQFGGERGKKFMYKPFKKLLIEMHAKTMKTQKKLIAESFENWKGSLEQVDDICIIGVRID